MKKLVSLLTASALTLGLAGCGDLEKDPKGALTEDQVTAPEQIDQLVIASYAFLGNDHYTIPHSFWATGNLRSGDAHKGGNGPGDIFYYHALSMYTPLIPDMASYPPDFMDINGNMWERFYAAISRTNAALNAVAEAELNNKAEVQSELRFVRGIFYFWLKIHYKHIPYIDETVSVDEIMQISNADLTDQQLWEKIAGDFEFAAANLPENQNDVGRANKYSAQAFLAKVRLFQAYEQNDQNEVVNINKDLLNQVVSLVDSIEASGKYQLNDDFAKNFLHEFENSKESVFAIQRSIDDGTPDGKGNFAFALNGPQINMDVYYGCCGFHIPTDNLVNAFKVDLSGLPMFDSYNDELYQQNSDIVDPRLDSTVGMVGKPFKYDPNLIVEESWARDANNYGTYVSMKELEIPECNCLSKNGPFTISSLNTDLIRYSDVLLWKAEALIQLDRWDEALPIINKIRQRAQDSIARFQRPDLTKTEIGGSAEYRVGLYTAFANKEEAFTALRWERRLEFAMEGFRFFDLVRWGVAAQTINGYLTVEKTRKPYLAGDPEKTTDDAFFVKGKHEYMPIPQEQINLSQQGAVYIQNAGY
ncbi:RagB/SusD family nutrient uptake outer membrane protein [Catenovulum sp. 2E275]|uniref:RagB/SusD family nutrient uptake outer membrane protein n=1 Tax=Catenovulum sp. 2E275 TaxID=2980497 RepID=UPI0021D07E86|nr:RagB/SusD family nutrient uptake outer membrane protein [Catenovulum sp. 2E275]MCU4677252.1 RagB/SusD family nutrient uptake outer membrane protein [Catenovulum sp. 2E275]